MICPDCAYQNPPDVPFCQACDTFLTGVLPVQPGPAAAGRGPAPHPVARLAGPPQQPYQPGPARGPGAPHEGPTGLRVGIEPQQLAVTPGETASATLTIRNTGTLVEEYVLRPEGPPWLSVEPAVLRVYPGQEATASLLAAPLRVPESYAGRGGFRVTVAATIHPGVVAAAGGTFTVAPFTDLRADLSPRGTTGGGQGRHTLRVGNQGNVPEVVRLDAADAEGVLDVAVPPAVEVHPGQSASVPVVVSAPRPAFGRPATHRFTVTADPGGGRPPMRFDGARTIRPRLPWWLPATAAGTVLVAAVAVPMLLGSRSGTPTPGVTDTIGQAGAQSSAQALPGASASSSSAAPGASAGASPSSGASAATSTPPPKKVPVVVPDVTTATLADATSALKDAGLRITTKKAVDNTAAAGTVLRSQPAAGASVPAGSTVTLVVSAGPTPTVDLFAAAPSAQWSNGSGKTLNFNGNDGDPNGFVLDRTGSALEDGSTPAHVLETHPEWIADGMIQGVFTLRTPVIAGDHFRGRVGFLSPYIVGAVTFEVAAQRPDGSEVPLWSIDDTAGDRVVRPVDVDLTKAAGATALVLRVRAGATAAQDWACWADIRLEGVPG